MTDNIYQFRKVTKPLRPSKYTIYVRSIDVESGAIIKDEAIDKMTEARCISFKYKRDSLKNRIELKFKEGTDLSVLSSCIKICNNSVVTINSLSEKNSVRSTMHLMCTFDEFEANFDAENKQNNVQPTLKFIVKQRLFDVDFEDKQDEEKNEHNQENTRSDDE